MNENYPVPSVHNGLFATSPPDDIPPRDHFAAFLKVKCGTTEIEEIRLVCGGPVPSARSLFDRPDNFLAAYEYLKAENERGQNIYMGAMPRDRVGDKKDDDISHGYAAWADFDHITPDEVKERLQRHGIPQPSLLIHSGNGVHAWWGFDSSIPARKLSDLVRDLADLLDADRKVFNPSRIMRVPGFMNMKDRENPKPCYVLEEASPRYDFGHFRSLVPVVDRSNANASRNVPRRLEMIAQGQRNATLTSLAGTLRRRGLQSDEILPTLFVVNEGRCNPPLSEAEVRAITISIDKYETQMPLGLATDLEIFSLTEMGTGERLAYMFRHEIRYCTEFNGWLSFDGTRWSSEYGEIERRAKAVARSIKDLAERIEDKELKKQIHRHYVETSRGVKLREMMTQASTVSGMSVSAKLLDSDVMLFNVTNGTIDLRTGKLRPHNREDLITKISPIVYDERAECPLWLNFLSEIMGGDAELVEYLQCVIGYCLTGDTGERVFFFFWGTGANGKTTAAEIFRKMHGDYASRAGINTFMNIGRRDHTNDLARLMGKRLVTASESERGQKLSEALVKELTGNEVITARFLYQEFFEFKPEFKIVISSNYKPVISDSDQAIWGRIRLIPFTVSIPEGRRDQGLGEKLYKELPGILRWAVEGCLKWQRNGLPYCKAVEEATGAYRKESDLLQRFLEECCELDPTEREPLGTLYEEYQRWADANGIVSVGKMDFSERLKRLGYCQTKSGNVRYWQGMRVHRSTE